MNSPILPILTLKLVAMVIWTVVVYRRTYSHSRSADCNLPHLYLALPLRVIPLEFRRDLWHQKRVPIVWLCLRDPMFSRLGTIPACDEQTDRRTDGETDGQKDERTHDDSTYRARMESRGKTRQSGWCRISTFTKCTICVQGSRRGAGGLK